jgi:hypothetical protein
MYQKHVHTTTEKSTVSSMVHRTDIFVFKLQEQLVSYHVSNYKQIVIHVNTLYILYNVTYALTKQMNKMKWNA